MEKPASEAAAAGECKVGQFDALCELEAMCKRKRSPKECLEIYQEIRMRMYYMDFALRKLDKDPESVEEENYRFDEDKFDSPELAYMFCWGRRDQNLKDIQKAFKQHLYLTEARVTTEGLRKRSTDLLKIVSDKRLRKLIQQQLRMDVIDPSSDVKKAVDPMCLTTVDKKCLQQTAANVEKRMELLFPIMKSWEERMGKTSFAKRMREPRVKAQMDVCDVIKNWLLSWMPEVKVGQALGQKPVSKKWRVALLKQAADRASMVLPQPLVDHLADADVWMLLQVLRQDPSEFLRQHVATLRRHVIGKLSSVEIRALVAHFGSPGSSRNAEVMKNVHIETGVKEWLENLWAEFDKLVALEDPSMLAFEQATAVGGDATVTEPVPEYAEILTYEFSLLMRDDECREVAASKFVKKSKWGPAKLTSKLHDGQAYYRALAAFQDMGSGVANDAASSTCLSWGPYRPGRYRPRDADFALPIVEEEQHVPVFNHSKLAASFGDSNIKKIGT